MKLSDINRTLLDEIQEAKVNQSARATTNRYMAQLRAVLRRAAYKWEWIDKAAKTPIYPSVVKRIRWITPNEAERLLSLLPEYQAAMARPCIGNGITSA